MIFVGTVVVYRLSSLCVQSDLASYACSPVVLSSAIVLATSCVCKLVARRFIASCKTVVPRSVSHDIPLSSLPFRPVFDVCV
eukprot:13295610-Heterocapsa_arctica.AAC.1